MQSTTLNAILNRMNRYQDIATVDDIYKVRDIDEGLRTQRRQIKPPWPLVKTTLRVFGDVLIYPTATDHDYLAYLDNPLNNNSGIGILNANLSARYIYTSLEQFYEDVNYRNRISEIWSGGTKYLGVRYKDGNLASSLASTNTVSAYAASGGASTPFQETVITLNGVNSVGFTNTSGTPAVMTETIPAFADSAYKSKYYFRNVYLTHVPTSITLKFGTDASNYLSATVTTQFAGQSFVANDWNIVAFDLNNCTTTGTINSNSFAYSQLTMTGGASGYYYLNDAYLRTWQLQDYWYYSIYNIESNGSTTLDKEFFIDDTTNTYEGGDALVGPAEWIDVITFDAMLSTLSDNKSTSVKADIGAKRQVAWEMLNQKYPDMAPVIITNKYNFGTNYPPTGFGDGDMGFGW